MGLKPSVSNYEKSKVVPCDKGGRPGTASLLEGASDTAGGSGARHPRSRCQDWCLERASFSILSLSSQVRRANEFLEVSLLRMVFVGLCPHNLISSISNTTKPGSAFQHIYFRRTQLFHDESVILTNLDAFP